MVITNADISSIQTALDLELPDFYCDFVLDYPGLLLNACEESSPIQLSNSADRIIQLNRDVRSSQHNDWEHEHFVIGESGCGDYYAIDVSAVDSPVYFWNHELGEFDDREESGSLLEFAGHVLEVCEAIREFKNRKF